MEIKKTTPRKNPRLPMEYGSAGDSDSSLSSVQNDSKQGDEEKTEEAQDDAGLAGPPSLASNTEVDDAITAIYQGAKKVNLSGQKIKNDKQAQRLFRAIYFFTGLELDLSNTKVNDYCAEKIAQALEGNSSLGKLNLSNADISNEGAKLIVKGLKRNNTLTALNLSNNDISKEVHGELVSIAGELNINIMLDPFLPDKQSDVPPEFDDDGDGDNNLPAAAVAGHQLAPNSQAVPMNSKEQKENSPVPAGNPTDENFESRNGSAISLFEAAKNGFLDEVKRLVENRADVNQANKNGATPLFIAAQNGHLDVVEFLVQNKADVNRAKINGAAPLLIAAQKGYLDVVKVLVKARADISPAADDGGTPLYIATQNSHLDVVEFLVQHKADVNQGTNNGESPLFIAAQKGFLGIVQLLVEHDADVNQARKDGATPFCIAAYNNHRDVVGLLLQNGGGNKVFPQVPMLHQEAEEKDGEDPVAIANEFLSLVEDGWTESQAPVVKQSLNSIVQKSKIAGLVVLSHPKLSQIITSRKWSDFFLQHDFDIGNDVSVKRLHSEVCDAANVDRNDQQLVVHLNKIIGDVRNLSDSSLPPVQDDGDPGFAPAEEAQSGSQAKNGDEDQYSKSLNLIKIEQGQVEIPSNLSEDEYEALEIDLVRILKEEGIDQDIRKKAEAVIGCVEELYLSSKTTQIGKGELQQVLLLTMYITYHCQNDPPKIAVDKDNFMMVLEEYKKLGSAASNQLTSRWKELGYAILTFVALVISVALIVVGGLITAGGGVPVGATMIAGGVGLAATSVGLFADRRNRSKLSRKINEHVDHVEAKDEAGDELESQNGLHSVR